MSKSGMRRPLALLLLVVLPVLTAAQADEFSPSTSPTSSPPYPPPILPSFPFPLPPRAPSLSPLDLDCDHVRCSFHCDLYCYEARIPIENYLACGRDCMDHCFGRSLVPTDVSKVDCRRFPRNFFGYVSKAKRSPWKRVLPGHF